MAPGPKRWLPDVFGNCLPCTGQGATSGPSPPSSPLDSLALSAEVTSTQPSPNASPAPATKTPLPTTKVDTSPTIGMLKAALRSLQTSLSGLPFKIAVDGLLECVVDLQVEERNRKSFEALASQLTDLVKLLQRHPVGLNPQNAPYSVEFVMRSISEQTDVIKAYQSRAKFSRLALALEDQEVVEEGYRRICTLFQQLQADISLSTWDSLQKQQMDTRIERLSPVHDAQYNAALPTTIAKRTSCTKNTRVKLLEDAMTWAGDRTAPKINWLNGMAGTGKTTIAYTICQKLYEEKRLAGSFFCSRNSPDCRDVRKIVPTIAYQLGQYSIPYKKALCDALEEDPDVVKKDISTQFKCLISTPLEKIGEAMPNDVVVVIDALDECADIAGTKHVLVMLMQHTFKLPIKFFVSSRPEPAISETMKARGGDLRSIIWLHDIEKSLVQADITVYLTEALQSIQVSPSEIDQLASRAGNLFIFAATAVRYILPETGVVNNRKRLLEVLALQPGRKSLSHQYVDNLYEAILANALDEKMYNGEELTTRRQVLWTAICAKEPLTIPALSELLGVSDGEDVRLAIQPLKSVLHVSEGASVVSALHASFPEFLLSKERAGQFYCGPVLQNSYLVECCFGVMGRSLKFNICGLESSYALDKEVFNIQSRVDAAISTGLFYSCRYWGDHLPEGLESPSLLSLLHSFLRQHLLFWMEVLSLKGQIGHGEVVLGQALAWLPTKEEWSELRDFTYDARNFLTSFAGNPTSLSTPHIYISALPFTSKGSRIRTTYWRRTQRLMEIKGAATEGRGKSVLATWNTGSLVWSLARSSDGRRVVSGSDGEVSVWDVTSGVRVLGPLDGHEGEVWSVAFSPDNSRIASSSNTIRIWDASNGDLVFELLRGHALEVRSVAFSPDGTRLASGLSDGTIRMWDPYTGGAIGGVLQGHQGAVRSVAFSPDGKHLASGSQDCTIRVWNWRTGATALGPLEGHAETVFSIAYSSDGLCLASGSDDRTVRVWDMSSGTLLAGPFEGHTLAVMSVSFSPSNIQVVSGSYDKTIRVWEAKSGNLLAGPFKGHSNAISSVLFTTDGTRILSGSHDRTIRVWDARHRTTGATESLERSDVISCVTISPDSTRVASSSWDHTVCLWDSSNGALAIGPFEGHTGLVNSVAFSPDGARIVSGSDDRTLRIWDASTGASLASPFEGHTKWVTSVAFSPDGARIASGSYDFTIQLWDSYTGDSVAAPFEGPTNMVRSITFSPNGNRIVSGSDDRTVRMWDANNGTSLWTSKAHTSDVYCVALSFDGKRVVSGSDDATILVLDAADGAVLHGPFTANTSRVNSVAFSPDGTRVVSVSDDRTVRVWDVQSGAVVAGPLKGHTKGVTSVVFSPDGARIVSGSYDGTIRYWDVAAATRSETTSFDGWSIDRDGWLIDSQSRRLFWVPSDLRDRFWFPTPINPLASNVHSTAHIDNTTPLGDRWHECYDTSLGSVSS